jgi:ubiquinone/menaquinone biosynthesis C-methylase UbiE
MQQDSTWDENLFRGSARYYAQGRLPYPAELAPALAAALSLGGQGCLLDVGCGPGILALQLASLFGKVVGLDPDADMLTEAQRRAEALNVTHVRWVRARAEDLPAGLGPVRVATFGRSFHWMD